jgi:hypothetical protein
VPIQHPPKYQGESQGASGLNRTPKPTTPEPFKTPSAAKAGGVFVLPPYRLTSLAPGIAAGFPKVHDKARPFKARQIESWSVDFRWQFLKAVDCAQELIEREGSKEGYTKL